MTQPTRSALLAASAVLLLFFFSELPAKAQNPPFQCVANAAVTPTVRSEGFTEQTGDIVINCTGGTPTLAGQPVPQANFTVSLNTQITSRILNPLTGGNETLLIVDDPGSKSNPNTPQLLCSSLNGCPVNAPDSGGIYDGASGHANIFQGQVSGSLVTFIGVPIQPATTTDGKPREFRITNVRANATGLAVGSQIMATTVISGNSALPVFNFSQPVGVVQQGVNFSVMNQQTAPNCLPFNNTFLLTNPPPGDVSSTLQFQAGFPGAFKPATVPGGVQNVPGTIYNSESNFILPADKANNLTAGLADFGTRLKAVFNNVPAGVNVFVSTNPAAGSTQGLNVQLTASETGPFAPIPPLGTSGTAQVPIVNGTGTAVWQVTASPDPFGTAPQMPVVNLSWYSSFQPPPNLNVNQPPATITAVGGFSGPFFPPSNSGLPGGFSFVSDAGARNLAMGYLGLLNGQGQQPQFIGGSDNNAVGVTTIASCQGAAQQLSVSQGISDTDAINLSVLFLGGNPKNVLHQNFIVRNKIVQTLTGVIGGGGNFIAPGGFETDGYSKQDFSYQVTPTATTDVKWLSVAPLNSGGTPTTFTVTTDPTGLAPGNYTGNISISALGQNSLTNTITATLPATLTVAPPGPIAPAAGFVSATTYQGSFAVPGMPLVIFGSAFGSSTLAGLSLTPDNTSITNSIAGTRVLFDGTPAPMIYSANGQISTIVPFELAGKDTTQAVVEYNGVQSPPVTLPVLDAAPGLFTANASGTGPGAILNGDGSYNSASNPAPVGSTIVLYASGAGQTNPPGKTGHLATAPYPTPVLPVSVFIDGVQATNVPYAGDAPGLFEGVLQVNAVIPAGVKPGNRTVVVKVGNTQTPPWATVAVSAAQ